MATLLKLKYSMYIQVTPELSAKLVALVTIHVNVM